MLKLLVEGVALGLLTCSSVAACPYCESAVGKQVAAGIFNEDFWYNAMLTLLPIPVLLGIVGVIHFGIPRPKRWPFTAAAKRSKASRQLHVPSRSKA